MSKFQQRRQKLRKTSLKEGVDGILVTNETNVSYLTGFTGDSSYLLLFREGEVILSDPRYTIQLEEECPQLECAIRKPGTSLLKLVQKLIKSAKLSRVALEANDVSLAFYEQLTTKLADVEWISTRGLVEKLREVKDREEVAAIRHAVQIAEKAFAVVRAGLRGEQTEKEIGDALDHQIRRFGGTGCSFMPIVGVGDRAALAHYQPGLLRVEQDPLLLIDWGAVANGYVSDLTRTLITAKPTSKLRKIFEIVLQANQKAIKAIRPGVLMHDIDAIARGVITDAGYGKRFGHSLGHGIGRQVHEQPRLAMNENRPLKAGMVVTIEPGIYLPGWGGIRIEDDILVTKDGHEVLSTVRKDFESCFTNL